MDSPLEQLRNMLLTDPLKRKIFVARSFSEGNVLLERICRVTGQLMNVEVQTVESLAEEHARLALYQAGKTIIRPERAFWVVRSLMEELGARSTAYIKKEQLSPQLVRRVFSAITELRDARVQPRELVGGHFLNRNKGSYLKQLLARYEQYLAEHDVVDMSGLVPYVVGGQSETIYVTMERYNWRRVERDLLNNIAGGQLIHLPEHTEFTETAARFPMQKAEFFHATGQLAEVREVFRRMLTEELALDDVELIAADASSYSRAIHTIASGLGVACTFSRGLPIESTNVGVVALQVLQWIEDGYPLLTLLEMLRLGQMKLYDSDANATSAAWIRTLEKANIGWGMERYTNLLAHELGAVEEEESSTEMASRDELHHDRLRMLQTLFKEWFAELPAGEVWRPIRLFRWLVTWLSAHANVFNPEDAAMLASLVERAEQLDEQWDVDMSKNEAIAYVRMLVRDVRAYRSPTPEPGKLHVTSPDDGALSGRKVTFLLGMDAKGWAQSDRQDPVLLDEEKKSLSPDLYTSEQNARLRQTERRSRLGMIEGQVTLSYTSYDVAEKKTNPPAYEMLQLYRYASGKETADFEQMNAQISGPVSYVPVTTKQAHLALDAADYVLNECKSATGELVRGLPTLAGVFPHMSKGWAARTAKEVQLTVNEYDGLVSPRSLQQAKATKERTWLSASQLETYATCPLRYYFEYELRMRKKELTEWDRSRWLTPLERGNLLHRIYYLYWKQPGSHYRAALTVLTTQVIDEFKLAVPVPSDMIFQKEAAEIHRDMDVFFEMERTSLYEPVFFEQALTLDGEPIELEFNNGVKIDFKGFIDRIDKVAPHEYRIIDYKTGSAKMYREDAFYAGGTQLQHALYTVAAEKWLRQSGYDAKARVREAAYVFPTERGRGEQVVRVENRRKELAQLLKKLLEAMEQGIFVPTKDERHCRYCDYRAGCGAHAAYMKAKREQPINQRLLEPLLEVESID